MKSSGGFSGRVRWFAAEIVVIVAGILIALAIDEWRQIAADRELEQEYLTQLVADLRQTEERNKQIAGRGQELEAAARQLVEAFEQGMISNTSNLDEILIHIIPYNVPSPVLGTLEALVSTGDLRLIGDLAIKSALTTYLSFSRDIRDATGFSAQHHTIRADEIRRIALNFGIVPGEPDISINDSSRNPDDADIDGFLADADAYSYAKDLYREKCFMGIIQRMTSSGAVELREKLEPLIEQDQ